MKLIHSQTSTVQPLKFEDGNAILSHTVRAMRLLIMGYLCIVIQEIAFTSTWWRHQMETFSALLAICAGNSPVPGEFLAQRSVTRNFDVFFDLRLNKWLSKQ